MFRLALVFLFISNLLPAQDFNINYYPLRNYKIDSLGLEKIALGFDTISCFKRVKGKDKKKYCIKAINDIKEGLIFSNKYDQLMKADTLTAYFQKRIDQVKAANRDLLNYPFTLFILRTGEPNASNLGSGVIYLNLELISRLNPEEVTYVLCHEMAHDVKKHVVLGIAKSAELYIGKEYKKSEEKIDKQKYNTLKQRKELETRIYAQYTKHSRALELEADSLGLVFYMNAGGTLATAVHTEIKLDSVDQPYFKNSIDIKKHFDFPEYPFDTLLLQNQTTSNIGNRVVFSIPDSLKTHPDCSTRAKVLSRIKIASSGASASKIADYDVQKRSVFEILEMHIADEKYDEALFYALELLEQYPENLFLKASVCNCLYEIHNAQVKHTFSKSVDFPGKDYPSNFNMLLTFLQNSNSRIILKTFNGYFDKNLKNIVNDPYVGYVSSLKAVLEHPEKKENAGDEYIRTYGSNYYSELLKKKFPKKNEDKKKK